MTEFTALHTNRLTIRRLEQDDWHAIHSYMCNPDVTRWLPEDTFNEADAKAFTDKNLHDGAQALAVALKGTPTVIGHMVFHPWAGSHTYEIGWVFDPSNQGQGFATEAARALLSHAFRTLKCHRVIATCQPENPASWRVMEKLNMRREGLFLKCIPRENGVWWDEYFYAIIAEEFEASTQL